ncbi:MAG: helix-turn-helix domain-containing protein [Cytophagales bacterium]|nr:helix-turn-helix domain-containing protein [Cytophagales bacterium]
MQKTITKGDVKITLFLNEDESVDLSKKMTVDYPNIDKKSRVMYPTSGNDGGVATIKDQFDLVSADRKFNETYHRIVLGQRIKKLREDAGLTQEQLAEKSGILRPNLVRIESGKYSTGIDIISQIAKALGKSLDIV